MPSNQADDREILPWEATRHKVGIALLAVGALAFFWWSGSSLCMVKNTTGIPCPGCGLTRATMAMLSGDWAAVWTYHPLAPVISPAVAGFIGLATLRALKGHPNPLAIARVFPAPAWMVVGLILVGLWVARLVGYLGGHPDTIDPWNSQPGLLLQWIGEQLGSSA